MRELMYDQEISEMVLMYIDEIIDDFKDANNLKRHRIAPPENLTLEAFIQSIHEIYRIGGTSQQKVE